MCGLHESDKLSRPDRLDIAVKSGTGLGRILAPTWEMVLGVKTGHGDRRWQGTAVQPLSEATYTYLIWN
ncbi:MAG: hypothetical protein ACYDBJ_22570 [Aggregatilineales bacterium]